MGLEPLNRTGYSRAVFALGAFVVKVPRLATWERFLYGLLGNMQETYLGQFEWPELCPVLFALPGGFAVVMRRAQVCTDADWPGEDACKEIISNANRADRCVPAELKPDSWGWLNGRLVAIDYG